MIAYFHFLRPEWLGLLIPAAVLYLGIRRSQDAARAWRGIIAPHLLAHLLTGASSRSRFGPPELIAVGWIVAAIAVAGPTWRHEPAPFADDVAALAIVVNVASSMKTGDVQPDRLTRSVQKIHDLLAERPGAKTALVAYAGSAHRVMPATTDAGIIDTFAQALDPKIMPSEGDAAADALALADQALAESGGGSILWITDTVAPEQLAAIRSWRKESGTPVRLLAPLLPGPEFDALAPAASAARARAVRISADAADVDELARAAKFTSANDAQAGGHWQEAGYALTPLIVLLLLPFFRRGWMAQTAARA